MRNFLAIEDIETAAAGGAAGSHDHAFLVHGRALTIATGLEDRCIRYAFSDASVGRDMHTVAPDAWDTRNFEANPVFLWAHDGEQPPIGRVEQLRTNAAGQLVGQVRYPDEGINPFADMVFRMVKGGYINATSTGWNPIEWKPANDRKRPGGVDFTRVELLEISQVPVPALPTALATARAQGIDTAPLYHWAERILDTGGLSMIPMADLAQLRKDARMPSPKRAKEATAPNPAEDQVSAPPASLPPVAAIVAPAAPAAPEAGQRAAQTVSARPVFKRGLGTVSWLACLLDELGFVQQMTAMEAEYEGDDSPIPGRLLEAVKALGAILVDMTIEEVTELLAGDEDDDTPDLGEAIDRARSLRALAGFDTPLLAGLVRAAGDAAKGRYVLIETSPGGRRALERVGKAISAENRDKIRAAHEHCRSAHETLAGLLDEPSDEDDDPETTDNNPGVTITDLDSERALRERKARALAAKARIAP